MSEAQPKASKKPQIIIYRETLLKSILSDAISFVMATGLVGMGRYIDSTALQWVGAILFFVLMSHPLIRKKFEVDLAGAREILDKIEKGEM